MDLFAMYLRKSRADMELEELGQGETLTRHYNTLMQLAERKGILPEQIVIFREVVSGESIAARPEMQKLLNDVYMKRFKAVLCMEVERLARGNTKDQGEVADAFTYSGTHILTPVKEYDPCNEFDQEYFEFGLFMSRREYKTIRRRMQAGIAASVNEGNYVGGVRIFGYDIKRISKKDRTLIEIPEESKIVKMVFNMWTEERLSLGSIARTLNSMNVKTTKGGEWSRSSIGEMLKNEHYIGMVRWNRRKKVVEYNDGTIEKKRKQQKSYELKKGKHEAIITEEQFQKAQTLFPESVPVKTGSKIVNPLAGILVCKHCGRPMSLTTDKRSTGESKRFKHPYDFSCYMTSCRMQVMIESIVDALKQVVVDYAVQSSEAGQNLEAERSRMIIEALEADLKNEHKKKARLFDHFEADDGTYTREEFLQRKKIYDESIAALNQKIAEAKQAAPEVIDYGQKTTTVLKLIDTLKDDSIDAGAKNIFLKSFIDRIEYDNENKQIILDIFLK